MGDFDGVRRRVIYLSGVDGNAVILVVDFGPRDGDIGAFPNVEAIGIGRKVIRIPVGVVHRDVRHGEIGGSINTEDLNRGILDVDTLDRGRGQVMGIEELGLCFTTIATLSIPPAGTLAIDEVTGSSRNLDVGSRDGDQRASPLLIAESSGSLKNHLQNFQ